MKEKILKKVNSLLESELILWTGFGFLIGKISVMDDNHVSSYEVRINGEVILADEDAEEVFNYIADKYREQIDAQRATRLKEVEDYLNV